MTRILGYLNHLTLYYKRLGPKQKNYIPSLRLHLCCIKRITFTQANQFTPINQKIDKENNSAKKRFELYEPFRKLGNFESIRVYLYC
jgi:hypothetical protein